MPNDFHRLYPRILLTRTHGVVLYPRERTHGGTDDVQTEVRQGAVGGMAEGGGRGGVEVSGVDTEAM